MGRSPDASVRAASSKASLRKVGVSWYKHPEPERIREIQPPLAERLGDIWPKAFKNFIFFPNSRPQNAEFFLHFPSISKGNERNRLSPPAELREGGGTGGSRAPATTFALDFPPQKGKMPRQRVL